MKTKQTTTVEKHVTSHELIKQGLNDFTILVDASEMMGKDITGESIVGFLAGYQSGLHALGLPYDDSVKIGLAMSETIKEIMQDGCGECDNCKKNEKAKKKTAKKTTKKRAKKA